MVKLFKENRKKIAAFLFDTGFLIEILVMIFANAGLNLPYEGRLLQLAAAVFGVKILLTKYSVKEWIVWGFAGLLTLIPCITMHETLYLQILLMLVAAKDVNRDRSLRLYFCLLMISMLLMAVGSKMGLTGDFVQVKDFERVGMEKRYCFGFSHPNVFYSNLLNLTGVALVLFFKKMKTWHYLVLTVMNIIFFNLSISRTGFIVVQIMILLAFAAYKIPQLFHRKVVCVFGAAGIAGMILCSWGLMVADYGKIRFLDGYLTGRIGLARANASLSTWGLLPQRIGDAVVDMGYVRLMASWGIIFGLLYILLIFLNYFRSIKRNDTIGAVVLFSYSLFTMIEAHALSMYLVRNLMFLLMIGWGIKAERKEYVSEEESNSGTVSVSD